MTQGFTFTSEGVTDVLRAVWLKHVLQANGYRHDHIRPAIVFGAGLMRGAYYAGFAQAFFETRLASAFTFFSGVSVGAISATYLFGGRHQSGVTEIFPTMCADRELFDPARRPPLSIGYLRSIIAGSLPQYQGLLLPEEGIARSLREPTRQLIIPVTRRRDWTTQFLAPRSMAEVYETLLATCSLPILSEEGITIGGESVVDGVCGETDFRALHALLAVTVQPTHYLVVAPQTFGKPTEKDRDLLHPLMRSPRPLPLAVTGRIIFSSRAFWDQWLVFRQCTSRSVVVGTIRCDGLSSSEQDPDTIRVAVEAARSWMLSAIEKARI